MEAPRESGSLDAQSERPMENSIICGDALTVLKTFPSATANLILTSPPYFGHRDYGIQGQIGIEQELQQYLDRIRAVLVELLRIVSEDGSCFVVIGDTYRKQRLLLVPHRMLMMASDIGWNVRNDLIWHKLDPPPESPRNRWRSSHEHVLFLTKRSSRYQFNADAIRVPYAESTISRWGNGQSYGGTKSQNRRNEKDSRMRHGKSFQLNPKGCLPTDVWSMPAGDSQHRHYATFSTHLVRPIIEACTETGEIVLDPFAGTGTACHVAVELGRRAIGIELNSEYAEIAQAGLNENSVDRLS